MGEQESNLMAHLPATQSSEVLAHIREGTNLQVFERLAQKENRMAELKKAKRESFEFEAFRFPSSGGRFRLGSPGDEPGRYDDENQKDAVITKYFEMQATPVTQEQWRVVMGAERQPSFKGNPDNPMESVSHDDAVAFAKRLSEEDERYDYRLATEAEWEVAVRAGTNSRFSSGDADSELGQYAWFSSNSGSKTHSVAALKPNANGLYDMHGNVWEWTADWYGTNLPEGVDPQGPASGSYRVIRGGGWSNGARYLRSAYRNAYDPGNRRDRLGFRLVRTPKP